MSQVPSTPPEISSSEDTPPDSLLARLRKITRLREAELSPPPSPESPAATPAPVDRLLAWLREKTGLSEARLPPERPRKDPSPLSSAPPVDRLMVWLRDATGVLTACFVILSVMLGIAVVWLGEAAASGIRSARAWGHEHMELRRKRAAEKKAAEEARAALQAAAPVFEPEASPGEMEPPLEKQTTETRMPAPAVVAVAAEPREETPDLWTPPPPGRPKGPRARLAWFGPAAAPVSSVADAGPDNSESSPVETAPVPLVPAGPKPRRFRRAFLGGTAILAASPAMLLVPAIRYSLTSYLGWGNAAVIAGRDGWLFPRPASSPALPALKETIASLRAGGATVVVISIPSKASIYPEKLDPSADGNVRRDARITVAQKELTDAGAQLLDLGPVLHSLKASDNAEDTVFRPHSSHWSPRAVEKSAAAAAAFIRQQPGYAALPLRPMPVELARANVPAPAEDLAEAFTSRRWHEAHAPQPLHFIRLLTSDKKPIPSETTSAVVLIGGDDARLYDTPALTNAPESIAPGESLSAGFAQYLSLYLSTPLELHTSGDSMSASKEWLAGHSEEERKSKRFIIWLLADEELLH